MKTTFTYSFIRTSIMMFVVTFMTISLNAQTVHDVAVTDGQFTPKDIVINVGETVVWTNTGANGHNVNGTQTTFPANPESFGNEVGLNWTYQYVFNTPGTYNYQCDPHAAFGMVGTVTVNGTTGSEQLTEANFRLYPNPASQYIELILSEFSGMAGHLKVYSASGTLVHERVLDINAKSYRVDLNAYKSGLYFIEVNDGATSGVLKFIKQ